MITVDIDSVRRPNLDFIKLISHAFLVAVLVLFLYDTFTLSRRTSIIPQLFVLASFVTLFAHYALSVRKADSIYELLEKNVDDDGPDGMTERSPGDGDGEPTKDKLSIENIGFVPFVTITGWLLLFAVAAFYIGFFVSVLVFVFVYVYWTSDEYAAASRIGYSAVGSLLVTAGTYVLLIEILSRTLLLRVGIIDVFKYV